jgi:hypothetical protein
LGGEPFGHGAVHEFLEALDGAWVAFDADVLGAEGLEGHFSASRGHHRLVAAVGSHLRVLGACGVR